VSGKKRELSDEEQDLWRRVVATAKPRRPQTAAPPAPPATKRLMRAQPAPGQSAPAAPPQARPPQDRGGEKRVRRGALEIGVTLDLHGHSQDSARAALLRFLRRTQARGDRVVVIVTGVGRDGEGVLKRRLPDWLSEPDARNLVSGFARAHRSHGGAGAFYVFLKRAR
jgi:DNA-nicking Smr family endonuclease